MVTIGLYQKRQIVSDSCVWYSTLWVAAFSSRGLEFGVPKACLFPTSCSLEPVQHEKAKVFRLTGVEGIHTTAAPKFQGHHLSSLLLPWLLA